MRHLVPMARRPRAASTARARRALLLMTGLALLLNSRSPFIVLVGASRRATSRAHRAARTLTPKVMRQTALGADPIGPIGPIGTISSIFCTDFPQTQARPLQVVSAAVPRTILAQDFRAEQTFCAAVNNDARRQISQESESQILYVVANKSLGLASWALNVSDVDVEVEMEMEMDIEGGGGGGGKSACLLLDSLTSSGGPMARWPLRAPFWHKEGA